MEWVRGGREVEAIVTRWKDVAPFCLGDEDDETYSLGDDETYCLGDDEAVCLDDEVVAG